MKKKQIEDEKINRLAQDYFVDDFSELEADRIYKLKNKVRENKINKKNLFLKLSCIATSLCCLILCIVLPITLKKEPLYTYTDLTRNEIPIDESENLIVESYPKYSFIFKDCDIFVSYGLYANNDLCILSLEGTKKNVPYTYIEFTLVINQKVDYPEYEDYTKDADITQNEHYIFYKKTISNLTSQDLFALFDYENYDLYLKFNRNDEEFLNKFL